MNEHRKLNLKLPSLEGEGPSARGTLNYLWVHLFRVQLAFCSLSCRCRSDLRKLLLLYRGGTSTWTVAQLVFSEQTFPTHHTTYRRQPIFTTPSPSFRLSPRHSPNPNCICQCYSNATRRRIVWQFCLYFPSIWTPLKTAQKQIKENFSFRLYTPKLVRETNQNQTKPKIDSNNWRGNCRGIILWRLLLSYMVFKRFKRGLHDSSV